MVKRQFKRKYRTGKYKVLANLHHRISLNHDKFERLFKQVNSIDAVRLINKQSRELLKKLQIEVDRL